MCFKIEREVCFEAFMALQIKKVVTHMGMKVSLKHP